MNKQKLRILTGDRPTGNLHIGHYFGSLENRVKLQEQYETFIIIADVQALTDNFEHPEKVSKNIREVFLDNLSVGLNPEQSTIFIQSMIPEIAELTVFFSNLVTVARLQRNPTVKTEISEKQELFGDSVTFGFLGYPVSQAADIAFVRANLVPVGEDQLPMIEQTREIVEKFNRIYSETFPLPEAMVGKIRRVKGIDGNAKMGKSLNNAIYLIDNDEVVNKKVMSAVTDPQKIRKDDKGHPKICTVFSYHQLFSAKDLEQIEKECKSGTRGCVDCKKQLIKNIQEFLEPIRERRASYEKNKNNVEKLLKEGTAKAKKEAEKTMEMIRENMKIKYF